MSLSDLGFPDYLFICENPEPKDRVLRKPDRKLNDVLLQFGMVLSDGVMNYTRKEFLPGIPAHYKGPFSFLNATITITWSYQLEILI